MRYKPLDYVEAGRIAGPAGENNGAFRLRFNGVWLQVIASDGEGWDHVSVSLPDRCPTWEEMNYVKQAFWKDNEAAMQLHPPRIEYVNNHPYCLHIWRSQTTDIPLPPKNLVGIQSLGVLQ